MVSLVCMDFWGSCDLAVLGWACIILWCLQIFYLYCYFFQVSVKSLNETATPVLKPSSKTLWMVNLQSSERSEGKALVGQGRVNLCCFPSVQDYVGIPYFIVLLVSEEILSLHQCRVVLRLFIFIPDRTASTSIFFNVLQQPFNSFLLCSINNLWVY